MFASKLRGNLRSVGYFVQHGYGVSTAPSSQLNVTEGNTNVTKLAVSALHQLASLPVDVWQDYKNQEHLRWVLHWAAKCRCTSPVFTKLLQQHLDVLCLDQCRDVDHCAHALFILNSPDRCLARNLMNRYVTIQSTGDPKYRHTQVLSLLLYCTLCGVECSALLKLISVDQLIQKCGVTQLQLLLLHNTLPVTADQRQQIMDKCSLWFQEDTKSQHSGRMYDMLSYFIGPKYTTGISLVDGVSVQALCIFNQDHEPVETDAYPADVYNGVSVDMTAATRHGFSVVACLGVKDTRLLRHPDHVPNGFVVLEASALKWQGCYCIPMILEHGAAKTQKSSRFVPDLMINYPDHIPVFKHLLAPKQ